MGVRPILFDIVTEYKCLYYKFEDSCQFESARLVLDKLFVLEQLEKLENENGT